MQDKKDVQIKQVQNLSKNEKSMVIGNWSCCKYGRKSSIINLNQCLTFEFKGDNSGYYLIPSGNKIPFEWEMLSDSIIDIKLNQIKNAVLKRGQYKIERDEQSQKKELKLINVSNEWSYFLIAINQTLKEN
jgi:hypothetical protein